MRLLKYCTSSMLIRLPGGDIVIDTFSVEHPATLVDTLK